MKPIGTVDFEFDTNYVDDMSCELEVSLDPKI